MGKMSKNHEEDTAMKTIKEILEGKGSHFFTIAPEASVIDALKLMAEKEVGALVVTEGGKLVGIISERDYARKVVLMGRASRDTRVKEIMTRRVICIQPHQSVDECMALMTEKRVRHLPVLSDGEIIGIVSVGDLVKSIIADQQFVIDQLVSYING
jgi:CBS domain-containing protein